MSTHGVQVRGGSGGIEAHYDDMVSAAGLFASAAAELGHVALSLHGYLADGGLITGGVFDPFGATSFEFDLVDALDGPGGVTWLAAKCAALDVSLRAAATAYEVGDRVLTQAHTVLDGVIDLPRAATAAGETFELTGSFASAFNRFVTQDPAITDELVLAMGGVRGPALRVADELMSDGHPVVADRGYDTSPESARPPRSLADLIRALSVRDAEAHGAIDVRILTRADGTRSVIVDLPGTKSWQPLPNRDVTSLAANVRAIVGRSTSYERGVLSALAQAGVRGDDHIMLVGHSEGGMVAVQTAIDVAKTRQFHVTHVVTAGAPIGVLAPHVPRDVQVLAIENAHDMVPHLDGVTNADRVNVTTCTIGHDSGQIIGDHTLDGTYLAGAADVDASDDTSIRAFLSSAQGYLDATTVETHRFVLTRGR
ncbi:MAG TPA: Mbeg1-like protein [Jatrophihabitantaceae bacterium]|nr:Mbeg1-like protein [Jatrophihabitantaceae bacterium]